jgi:hypothetical protein
MPRAPLSLTEVVIAYFFAVTGLAFIGVNLSLVVAANVIALSLPHIASQIEPPTSRIEQRRIDVARAVPPMPIAKVAALKEPAVSHVVLAAQLDLAEAGGATSEAEMSAARGAGRAKLRLRRLASQFATRPAADAFNRSFGVLPIASN